MATGRKGRRRQASRPPGRKTAGPDRRAGTASNAASSFWSSRRWQVLQFVVVLAVATGLFNIVFLVWLSDTTLFERYLGLNAEVSAAVLRLFGEHATSQGASLISPRYSLNIARGCEAVQVAAFFLFAVAAWPLAIARWRRWLGGVAGVLTLMVCNIVRIVSLYYTGIYLPGEFETMHIDVWQPMFILLALLVWVAWIWWASRPAAQVVRHAA